MCCKTPPSPLRCPQPAGTLARAKLPQLSRSREHSSGSRTSRYRRWFHFPGIHSDFPHLPEALPGFQSDHRGGHQRMAAFSLFQILPHSIPPHRKRRQIVSNFHFPNSNPAKCPANTAEYPSARVPLCALCELCVEILSNLPAMPLPSAHLQTNFSQYIVIR
jgi:hypothetical protein